MVAIVPEDSPCGLPAFQGSLRAHPIPCLALHRHRLCFEYDSGSVSVAYER